RGAVSNSGLVFEMHDPQGAHRLYDEVVEFVGIGTTAGPGDGLAAIDGVARRILLNECIVAGLLYFSGDLVKSIIPGNIFPLRGAGTAYLRLQQTPIVQNVLLQRGSLGTQRPAIDRVVRITFHVNNLRGNVLGAIADRIDNDAAAH